MLPDLVPILVTIIHDWPLFTPWVWFKSCFPHHGTPCKSRGSDFLCAEIPKPYPNITQWSHVFYEGLQPVCRLPAHGLGHMAVAVQGEGCRVVPHVFLQSFDIVPRPEAVHREGVPLGYNNDKTGNPYGTRVLSNSGCWIQFLFHRNEGSRSEGKEGLCKTNDKKVSRFQRVITAVSDAPNHRRDVTFSITIS